jgi:hypothetical protein
LRARDGNELSSIQVFDLGCAESRVRELIDLFIAKFSLEHMRELADKQKRAFQAVTPYPYDDSQKREMFYERARVEAVKILEQEKKNVVDFHSPHIKRMLQTYLKQLRYVLLDDGHPFKVYSEETMKGDSFGKNPIKTIVSYTRSEIIRRWRANLAGYSDFRPYLNPEVEALWKESEALESQEGLLSKKELSNEKEASKTEKAEVQEGT